MATTKTATAKDVSQSETRQDPQDIEAHVARVREDIAGLAKAVQAYGANKTGEYRDRANKAGQDLADASQEAIDSLRRELASLERQMSRHVRERPLQSLGIAAGLGFLIAMLVRR